MCFKKPKLVEPVPDPELKIARENAMADLLSQKLVDRTRRGAEARSRAIGTFGLRSLISGSQGGAGFSLRSLIGG